MTASLPQPPDSPSSDTEAAAASAESSSSPRPPAKPRAPRAPRATTPRAPRTNPARPKAPAAADAGAADGAPEAADTPKAPATPRSPRTTASRSTTGAATPRTPAKKPANPRATAASSSTARTPAAKKPAAKRPVAKKPTTSRASATPKPAVDEAPPTTPPPPATAPPEFVIPPRPPLPVPSAEIADAAASDPTPADVAVEEPAVEKLAVETGAESSHADASQTSDSDGELPVDDVAPTGGTVEAAATAADGVPVVAPDLVTETPLEPPASGDDLAASSSSTPAPDASASEQTDESVSEPEQTDASPSAVAAAAFDGTPADVRVDDAEPVVLSDEIESESEPEPDSASAVESEAEATATVESEPEAGSAATPEPEAEPEPEAATSSLAAVDPAPSSDALDDTAVAVLTLRGVTKTFGELRAVDAIDLTVPAGSFYGLVGPNGAGKTTTLSIIAGLLRADGGSVTINGIDAAKRSRETKKMIGVLPDRLRTFDRLTGRQLLSYYGALRGLPAPLVESRVADLARAFDLVDALARPVSDYSAGMTKKVMLAGAMIHSPRVLVLDEPFEAVDPVSSGVILDILGTYVAHGGTVILSSHGMELVERVCSRVAVIVSGQVLAEGTVDEVRGEATLEQRFLELAGGLGDVEGLEWLHTFSA
ncbi:ABC transporter ATP-binding protein [Microbacterium trichothecenolyticum]|uniref:ABC-2 type transport system ATP-binding protein n=1 Tax=Microbacterium trichothecenolyticum TaxID=69370 RepID=A0ABU0TQA7_MICTR|nr:ABC transporter ATP-binding protein [Microbacterium trichothecenolyticum]MDQ1121835.1 ABC-2 type transport system ATP-binding protein [Microbacterium trichothecenolyticum]